MFQPHFLQISQVSAVAEGFGSESPGRFESQLGAGTGYRTVSLGGEGMDGLPKKWWIYPLVMSNIAIENGYL